MEKQRSDFWLTVSAYYRQTIPDEVLQMYVDHSEAFSVEQLKTAFNKHCFSTQAAFFPTPAVLINYLLPKLDEKQEAVRRMNLIKQAVRKFGYMQREKAKEFLGKYVWDSVERIGGWQYLCESPDANINDPIVYAQVRDSVQSQVSAQRQGIEYDALSTSGNEIAKLEHRKKVDFMMSELAQSKTVDQNKGFEQ